MIQDQNLNLILKQMWALDHKITVGEALDSLEKEFYNKNLEIIKKYYKEQNIYWDKNHKIIL